MTTTHRIGTSVALALALVASAAPAGARPFDLNASGSEVPAGSPSMHVSSQPTQPAGVPPVLSVATRSQRAALQQAQQHERLAYLAHHQPKGAQYSSAEMNAYATRTGVPSTVVRVVSHDGRFDWGDAGIGAAGGLGLALVGLGGAFAISQQRQARRSKGSAAISS
jgi:hypothetical protein